MSDIQIPKICQACGKEFIAGKNVTKFCSHSCSSRAYKERKRNERLENVAKIINEDELSPDNSPIINNREFLSVLQTAELMGVSRATVNRYCVEGKIPCMKMNRKIFIRRKDIDLLFEKAAPYEVTPLNRQPITEFYTLEEIVNKYEYSPASIFDMVRIKQIPKLVFRGKTIYSKKNIDRHFALKMPDPGITRWSPVEEISAKYDMKIATAYCLVSEHDVPRKNVKGRTYYSTEHVDAIMRSREPDPQIKEWYSMDDIAAIYNLAPGYVSNLIHKNAIPKTKRGNKGYYSKTHFDALMQGKMPALEYYTVEEATEKYGISRDSLYQHIKRHGIPTEKEGRYIKVSKSHLDKQFN